MVSTGHAAPGNPQGVNEASFTRQNRQATGGIPGSENAPFF
jgi:hypothetical protein